MSAPSPSAAAAPPAPAQQRAARAPRADLWRGIARLLLEFWRAHRLACAATVVLQVTGNARTGLYLVAMGGLVDSLVGGAGAAGGRPPVFWAGLYVAASALEQLYWLLGPILSSHLLDHGAYRIRRRILVRAAAAPLIQLEEKEFFDHLTRADAGLGERLAGVWTRLTDFAANAVRASSIAVALLGVHPALPLLLAAGVAPTIWLRGRVAALLYDVRRAHTTRDRMRAHLAGLLTGREAAAELRLFGAADYLLGRWTALRGERTRDLLGAERRRSFATTGAEVVAGAAYAGGLALVAGLILQGQLSVGDFVAVATGALWFQGMATGLVSSLTALEEQSLFLGDLIAFERAARSEGGSEGGVALAHSTEEGRTAPRDPRERGVELTAHEVTFTYPTAALPSLRGVSVRIGRGERIAIVGENGAGKTTLAKLLVGLYEPDAGEVRLDGVPLTGAGAVAARGRIAAVFQDYAAYELTARENIGFGNVARLGDAAALHAAADRADIGPFVRALPTGLDAYLGRRFGKTDLSGGQWQRVALARAFFRDADLLVLDEPTAALDPLAELALFERFAELVEGRTAIMISHRLGAARLADRVLVLEDGRLVEEGPHDELVAGGGPYAALFAAQAQWYR